MTGQLQVTLYFWAGRTETCDTAMTINLSLPVAINVLSGTLSIQFLTCCAGTAVQALATLQVENCGSVPSSRYPHLTRYNAHEITLCRHSSFSQYAHAWTGLAHSLLPHDLTVCVAAFQENLGSNPTMSRQETECSEGKHTERNQQHMGENLAEGPTDQRAMQKEA